MISDKSEYKEARRYLRFIQEIDSSTLHFCEVGRTGERMPCFGSLDGWFVNKAVIDWGN